MSSHPTDEAGSTLRQSRHHRRIRRNLFRSRWRQFTLTQGSVASAWNVGSRQTSGAGLIADWLVETIRILVAHYSRPGSRVLLLAPPPVRDDRVRWTSSAPGAMSNGPLAGLSEAAWSVLRLGRHVETATASPLSEPDYPTVPEQPPAEQFDLIITSVDPRATGWVRATRWAAMLAPHGTVALITHGDIDGERWHDPTTALATAVEHQNLSRVDHIALVTMPTGDDIGGSASGSFDPARPGSETVHHRRHHHDLILFAHRTEFPNLVSATEQVR